MLPANSKRLSTLSSATRNGSFTPSNEAVTARQKYSNHGVGIVAPGSYQFGGVHAIYQDARCGADVCHRTCPWVHASSSSTGSVLSGDYRWPARHGEGSG